MTLDVILATYNRSEMLIKALRSLEAAEIPAELDVNVYVVDNASTDRTRERVEAFASTSATPVHYLYEGYTGKSAALNHAIASSAGDVIAMIDDDEQVDRKWFCVLHEWMSKPEIDYVGGPYLPDWEIEPPDWLPEGYDGVIGRCDRIRMPTAYGSESTGPLMGGNAVIRRRLLELVGPYAVDLGRMSKGLGSCEDHDMFLRLQRAGARGMYVPDMAIRHFVPAKRLTRAYYRQWCFDRAVSLARLDRDQPEPVTYLFGVPRYFFGNAIRAAVDSALRVVTFRNAADRHFGNELAWWHLVGFLYGKVRLARLTAAPRL